MTEEVKEKLRKAGRQDLIDVYEINKSGYAGIMPNGNIVDRRHNQSALPIPENIYLGIPKPKSTVPQRLSLDELCDKYDGFARPVTDFTQEVWDIAQIWNLMGLEEITHSEARELTRAVIFKMTLTGEDLHNDIKPPQEI